MSKKCKYYLRAPPDPILTTCGHEVDDFSYDTYCTFCGKLVKEVTTEDPPEEVLNLVKRSWVYDYDM